MDPEGKVGEGQLVCVLRTAPKEEADHVTDDILSELVKGEKVAMVGDVFQMDSVVWCSVEKRNGKDGFIKAKYVTFLTNLAEKTVEMDGTPAYGQPIDDGAPPPCVCRVPASCPRAL